MRIAAMFWKEPGIRGLLLNSANPVYYRLSKTRGKIKFPRGKCRTTCKLSRSVPLKPPNGIESINRPGGTRSIQRITVASPQTITKNLHRMRRRGT